MSLVEIGVWTLFILAGGVPGYRLVKSQLVGPDARGR